MPSLRSGKLAAAQCVLGSFVRRPNLARRAAAIFALAMLPMTAGCPNMLWPNRGPVEIQRAWDQAFDPYPDPDAGPNPLGSRPQDFDKPMAEPLRSRVWGAEGRKAQLGYQ